MKKVLVFLMLLLGVFATLPAQKIGYVETQAILDKMIEYQAIQKEIDDLSEKWQKELDAMYKQIEKKYDEYRAKEVLLSKEDKQKMEDEILDLETKAKEYQKKRFGYNGELFKLREEKMRPLQEKVFKAVEEVAKEKGLSMIFDKSGGVTMVYSDAKYNYSGDVMKKLGVDPNAKPAEPPKPDTPKPGGR